jgi:hypothetical protein
VARPSRWTEVSKRGPAPPLLRPQRRWSFRTVLLALFLCLAGALGGVVIGLGLRPPPATPVEPQAAGQVAPPVVATPMPSPPAPAASDSLGLEAQLAALRRAAEQEQARLDALARARVAAETQLAALQRDLAAAQRDAAQQRDVT